MILGVDWVSENVYMFNCLVGFVECLSSSYTLENDGEYAQRVALLRSVLGEKGTSLDGIFVVREYLDVFHADITKLPLEREVEFLSIL